MNTETATKTEAREFFATIRGVEYCVEVRTASGDRDGKEYWWVDVKEYQPELRWWKSIFSESAYDCRNDMEAVRDAFKRQCSRMRDWVNSWRMHRQSAAEETGGKRAYYTKHANAARKYALEYAAKWRLCKAIWKEFTKL